MESWAVVFLGLIALSSLVQTVMLVLMARSGQRMAARVDELQQRLDREVRPSLDNLNRITRNVAEISDVAALQARRVDDVLADTFDKVEQTTSVLRNFILRPLGPLADILAFLKGVRRGLEVYRQLGGIESERRGAARRYSEDEHLFI